MTLAFAHDTSPHCDLVPSSSFSLDSETMTLALAMTLPLPSLPDHLYDLMTCCVQQTYNKLGDRQYQLVIHSRDGSPLVLNTADAACFDVWGFSLRVHHY